MTTDQQEAIIKAQIFTLIPDSLLIEVQKLKMAKEIWEAMCVKHEKKTLNVMVDIHHCIYEHVRTSHKSERTWKPLRRCRSNLQEWMWDSLTMTCHGHPQITSKVISASH